MTENPNDSVNPKHQKTYLSFTKLIQKEKGKGDYPLPSFIRHIQTINRTN